MKIDHEAALERIRTKLRRRFPVGCRVKMTREAASGWRKYAGVTGTVVHHAYSGTAPAVLWDGRKTATSYHPDFLRRARS